LKANPNAIIVIQGTDSQPYELTKSAPVNWGGSLSELTPNLSGAPKLPLDRVIWSPHQYPLHGGGNFTDEQCWELNWGWLLKNKHAIQVGEWGAKMEGDGLDFMKRFAPYLAKNNIDSFHWTFNANSGDTGGLLDAKGQWAGDTPTWKEPDKEKLELVASAHPNPTNVIKLFTASGVKYSEQ